MINFMISSEQIRAFADHAVAEYEQNGKSYPYDAATVEALIKLLRQMEANYNGDNRLSIRIAGELAYRLSQE